ncbi:hypothetical protein GCM10009838_78490 [Catenulispora subtropica]|uniref:Uncharacterized protein n=1 Tax=Catenulispora subtropica TaxID=450798 RepID=A0ABN2T7T7_9ACTN
MDMASGDGAGVRIRGYEGVRGMLRVRGVRVDCSCAPEQEAARLSVSAAGTADRARAWFDDAPSAVFGAVGGTPGRARRSNRYGTGAVVAREWCEAAWCISRRTEGRSA